MAVLMIEALLFGFYVRAPHFGNSQLPRSIRASGREFKEREGHLGELGGRRAGFAVRDAKKNCSRCKVFASRAENLHVSPPFSPGQPFLPRNLNVELPFPPVGRTVYYFTIFTISFPFGSRQRFLHLGSRNLNVEPPFPPVGRTVYDCTILRFHFNSVPGRGFCISGRET